MYDVAEVWSLHGLARTDSGVELRVGDDVGGGVLSYLWFVPIVDGRIDLKQQTDLIDTTASTPTSFALYGARPNYLLHSYRGFRSAPVDTYATLAADLKWTFIDAERSDYWVGLGIWKWSKGRFLEWRAPVGMAAQAATSVVPKFRVIGGDDDGVPMLPEALAAELEGSGFRTTSAMAFASGEVLAVGHIAYVPGFSTLLWRSSKLEIFRTPEVVLADDTDLYFLGGSTLDDVRLVAAGALMRLENDEWTPAGSLSDEAPPDVWFGRPLTHQAGVQCYVRLGRDESWRPLAHSERHVHVVIDDEGVVWSVGPERILRSSKKPEGEMVKLTKSDWETSRKKLGLQTQWSRMDPQWGAPHREE